MSWLDGGEGTQSSQLEDSSTMKKRGLGSFIAVLVIAVVVFVSLYGVWNFLATAISTPPAVKTGSLGVNIQNGESTDAIANNLYSKGLISNPLIFRFWARIRGLDTHLEAGSYSLTPGMSIDQIIAKLQNGQPDARTLLVKDGWRIEQIAYQINQLGLSGFNEQQFLTYAHNPSQFPDVSKYPILKGASSMEGLLFPDTYFVPVAYNTVQITDTMLDEFEQVVQQNNLVALAQQHQLTAYQMVILASIVQREAGSAGQMPLIAGIYWKRIHQPSPEIGTLLQADPTVQYARDTDHPPASVADYWKPLDDAGGHIDPPNHWNTYTFSGWPPTPISSPNLKALEATASPQQTNCYYFLNKASDGSLVCATTLAQFQQLEKKYLPPGN